MNPFRRIQYKLLAAILFVVLLPLIGTGLYGNWITSGILRDRVLNDARSETERRALQIESFLDDVAQDVLMLSDLSTFRELLAARADGDETSIEMWRRRVQDDFRALARRRGIYDQVRYISEDGQEFIRVDSNGYDAYPLPREALQNKAHRYYFQETMRLAAGQVFVSPLDLNREHGEIEIPYQPVIRYATPVFDRAGRPRGIVILNVFADRFLQLLREQTVPQQAHFLLVDQDGYYLVHPDPEQEWGSARDLNTQIRLSVELPDLAPRLLSGEPGEVLDNRRAIVYTPVYPQAGDPSRYWVLIYEGNARALFAPIREFRTTAVLILIAAVLVATAIATALARSLSAPIQALQKWVEAVGRGELQSGVAISSGDEIGELARAFGRMVDDLERSRQQRQHLLERIISAQEEERRLVAYDIHDGLIQRLVGARMQLSNFLSLRQQDETKAQASLERASHHLAAAIQEGRRLVDGLRPSLLDDLGLAAAVERIADLTAHELGCELSFESNLDGERLPHSVEITAFRIMQEALSNVRKHSLARQVHVELTRTSRSLILVVRDSGIGFDAARAQDGQRSLGLISMSERARLLNGRLEITSAPGEGTTVTTVLPLDTYADEPEDGFSLS
ncbi:MAG: HAMP domain-containing protein [Caldilineae bacterium]|nr:MAG: HAMP domain-containing protein [Caldilineae bacterium]